jgi:predicted dinucleotide-utilizing enzyme
MKVRVLRDEYWNDCVSISAEMNGREVWIPYALVDGADLIPSSRTDGIETIILTNGMRAKVQSIDLDYDVACEASPIGAKRL